MGTLRRICLRLNGWKPAEPMSTSDQAAALALTGASAFDISLTRKRLVVSRAAGLVDVVRLTEHRGHAQIGDRRRKTTVSLIETGVRTASSHRFRDLRRFMSVKGSPTAVTELAL